MSTPTGLFRGSRVLRAAKACSTTGATATAAVTEVNSGGRDRGDPNKGSASNSKVQQKFKDSGIDLTKTKTIPISPALQSFVGCHEISLYEAGKKLCAHIEGHKLQTNQSNELILDATLQKLFDGRDKLKAEELAELLCAHFVKN